GTPPIPSLADVFYLLYSPAMYVGLVLLVRSRLHRFSPTVWLDGGIAAATAVSVIAAIAFEPILSGATSGGVAAVATNLAYPVGDLLLLVIVIGVFALSGWRPGRQWLALGGGLALTAIADTAYLYESARGGYQVGGILDSLWVASALCVGFAAWQPSPSRRRIELEGRRLVVIPFLSGLVALALLFYGGAGRGRGRLCGRRGGREGIDPRRSRHRHARAGDCRWSDVRGEGRRPRVGAGPVPQCAAGTPGRTRAPT